MTPDRITSFRTVRKVLDQSDSKHTPILISLMENGKNHPYACKPAVRLAFGPNENDFPGLGKKLSPFGAKQLPSLEDLQIILIDDVRATQNQYGDPMMSTAQGKATAASRIHDDPDLELLNNLASSNHNTRDIVLSFPSPLLDDICGDAKFDYDNVLRESMTTATVLHGSTLLPLQHSNEGFTYTTLLSGAVAWIIWPPTEHNLGRLQQSYEAFARMSDGTKLDVADELEGGVCLVQTVGDAIRVPPFCPIMCLSLQTSVLATHSIVTISEFVDILHKLSLLQAWFKTETHGERKKTEFTAALLEHLSSILQGSFESTDLKRHKYPYLREGPLRALLHSWDGAKSKVADILDPADAERVKLMWVSFLRNASGRECWICGESIYNKLRLMREHFEAKHWPEEKTVEVVAQEGVPQSRIEDAVVPLLVLQKTGGTNLDDVMDIDKEGVPEARSENIVTPPLVLQTAGETTADDTMELTRQ